VNVKWVPCERGVRTIRVVSCVMMWGVIIMIHDASSTVHLGFTFWLYNTFSNFFFFHQERVDVPHVSFFLGFFFFFGHCHDSLGFTFFCFALLFQVSF